MIDAEVAKLSENFTSVVQPPTIGSNDSGQVDGKLRKTLGAVLTELNSYASRAESKLNQALELVFSQEESQGSCKKTSTKTEMIAEEVRSYCRLLGIELEEMSV